MMQERNKQLEELDRMLEEVPEGEGEAAGPVLEKPDHLAEESSHINWAAVCSLPVLNMDSGRRRQRVDIYLEL